MTTLRQLAEAAKGWAPTHAVPANDEDPCRIGVMDADERFEDLGTIDLENHFGDSMLLANFIIAANPAAILAMLDTIDAQRRLLERVEVMLMNSAYRNTTLGRDITAHLEATK